MFGSSWPVFNIVEEEQNDIDLSSSLTIDIPNSEPDHVPPIIDKTKSSPSPEMPTDTNNYDLDFYFRGGFVVLKVEDRLFRVPAYIFAIESNHFVTEINISIADEYKDSELIFFLPADIRHEDFRNLLKALYPTSARITLSLSETEWISVLKLSTKWKFENLRKLAITHLDTLPPLRKIILGRQYFVPTWFLSGLHEMANRNEVIRNHEADQMGHTIAFKLTRLREKKLRNRSSSSFRSSTAHQLITQKTVDGEFGSESHIIEEKQQQIFGSNSSPGSRLGALEHDASRTVQVELVDPLPDTTRGSVDGFVVSPDFNGVGVSSNVNGLFGTSSNASTFGVSSWGNVFGSEWESTV
ncbi:hypothetical protein BDN70DRAFT_67089 [Pholiota conissans]|uniref:BTB domain-containing protein n=1 Tax=Pholiota conissans TaxID=109636 RepID=A0A9P5YZ24_9AGAR|nr:hypothetical protein BDN70DRAFT_67089 [Pholiota conissans]